MIQSVSASILQKMKKWLVNNAMVMDRKVACERREPVLMEV